MIPLAISDDTLFYREGDWAGMSKPFLGKLDMKWCESCNVPLIGKGCTTCGSDGRKVTYSPPGDIRPAFEQDLAVVRNAISEFDPEVDMLRGVVLLNAISSKYELEEVIAGGQVLGFLRERRSFAPRADFAAAMRPRRRIVNADPGALPSLMKSSNLMAPGVLSMSEGIEVGDEVVVNVDGVTVATGKARISSVGTVTKGVAVKVRHRVEGHGFPDAASTLEDAVAANADALSAVEERAVRGVQRAWESVEVPKMVSFSGGKDSLAMLLLVIEAGYSPMMFFIDTGLELPGTLEYVQKTAREHGLDLTVAEAGDAFLDGLKHFGPPAKDYRWCCKTNKLGPTARTISEKFPGGVMAFIGQRMYESQARARQGARWNNPWVPGQQAFSPIQTWTALHVWLYLFWKGAEANPWYFKGLERIGCSVCPAADENEGAVIAKHVDMDWWNDELEAYAGSVGLPPEWAHGDWRWRRPKEWATEADWEGYRVRHADAVNYRHDDKTIMVADPQDCDDRLLPILDGLDVTIVDSEDGVAIGGGDRDKALQLMIRGRSCVGCGICTVRCPTGAIFLENGRVEFDEGKCTRCLECLGPCPVVDFHPLRFRPRM